MAFFFSNCKEDPIKDRTKFTALSHLTLVLEWEQSWMLIL